MGDWDEDGMGRFVRETCHLHYCKIAGEGPLVTCLPRTKFRTIVQVI